MRGTDRIRGIVVDNRDPKKAYGLRIRTARHRDTPDEHIPWAQPISQSIRDGKASPPAIGKSVQIDDSDPQEPLYYGGDVITADSLPPKARKHFPDRQYSEDDAGNTHYVDRRDGDTMSVHQSGTAERIDQAGNKSLQVVGKFIQKSEDTLVLASDKMVLMQGEDQVVIRSGKAGIQIVADKVEVIADDANVFAKDNARVHSEGKAEVAASRNVDVKALVVDIDAPVVKAKTILADFVYGQSGMGGAGILFGAPTNISSLTGILPQGLSADDLLPGLSNLWPTERSFGDAKFGQSPGDSSTINMNFGNKKVVIEGAEIDLVTDEA